MLKEKNIFPFLVWGGMFSPVLTGVFLFLLSGGVGGTFAPKILQASSNQEDPTLARNFFKDGETEAAHRKRLALHYMLASLQARALGEIQKEEDHLQKIEALAPSPSQSDTQELTLFQEHKTLLQKTLFSSFEALLLLTQGEQTEGTTRQASPVVWQCLESEVKQMASLFLQAEDGFAALSGKPFVPTNPALLNDPRFHNFRQIGFRLATCRLRERLRLKNKSGHSGKGRSRRGPQTVVFASPLPPPLILLKTLALTPPYHKIRRSPEGHLFYKDPAPFSLLSKPHLREPQKDPLSLDLFLSYPLTVPLEIKSSGSVHLYMVNAEGTPLMTWEFEGPHRLSSDKDPCLRVEPGVITPFGVGVGFSSHHALWEKVYIESDLLPLQHRGDLQAKTLLFKAPGLDNRYAKMHAEKDLILQVEALENEGGSLSGVKSTYLEVHRHLRNLEGYLGAAGKTVLKILNLLHHKATESMRAQIQKNPALKDILFEIEAYMPPLGADTLGTIQGDTITLHTRPGTHLRQGILAAQEEIVLEKGGLVLEEITFQAPTLTLRDTDFILDPQNQVKLTRYVLKPYQDWVFKNAYATKGRIEIQEEGIRTKEAALVALASLSEAHAPDTFGSPKIGWTTSFEAKKGLRILGPAHAFVQKTGFEKPGIDVRETAFKAYLRGFDLEEGLIVAQDAHIHAPQGIRIGRRVIDPDRRVFTPLWLHGYCYDGNTYPFPYAHPRPAYPNDHDLVGLHLPHALLRSYRFLDQCTQYTNQGVAIAVDFPVAISNGATLLAQGEIYLTGPLLHYGILQSQNLFLESSLESTASCSTLDVTGTLFFKGPGGILLTREVGQFYFTPHNTYYPCPKFPLSFIGSEPVRLTARSLRSFHPIKLINEAGQLIFQEKDTTVALQAYVLESGLAQKIFHKAELTSIPNTLPRTNFTACINEMIFYTCDIFNLYPRHVPALYDFHLTSQKVFTPVISSGQAVTFGPQTTQLQGALTAPLMLMKVSEKGLVLGTPNPYYTPPKKQLCNLAEGRYQGHLTAYLLPHLQKKILEDAPLATHFKWTPKYWFDERGAQEFYKEIGDTLVVLKPNGTFEKPAPGSLFTLSPELLLQRVKEETLATLNRGSITFSEDPAKNTLTLETLKELHQNMADYVKVRGAETLSTALWAGTGADLQTLAPDQPVLYYVELLNEAGILELTPRLLFPRAMVDQANGGKQSKILAKTLLTVPEGMTPFEALLSLKEEHPHLFHQILRLMGSHPQMMLPSASEFSEEETSRALVTMSQEGALERRGGSSGFSGQQKPGSVTVQGAVETQNILLLSPGDLKVQGQIKADQDALIGSLGGDTRIESQKTRQQRGYKTYQDIITDQAGVEAGNNLGVLSRDHTILSGAQTRSANQTVMRSGGSVIDRPVTLESHHETFTCDDDKIIHQVNHTTRQHVSQHHFGTLKVKAGQGIGAISATYEGQKATFQTLGSMAFLESHDTFSQETHVTETKDTWWGGSRTKSWTSSYGEQTSRGPTFKLTDALTLESPQGQSQVILQNPTITSPHAQVTTGTFALEAGTNASAYAFVGTSKDMWQTKTRQESRTAQTYTPPSITGRLEVDANRILVQTVEGSSNEFLSHVIQTNQTSALTHQVLQNLFTHHVNRTRQLGPAPIALIGLASTLATCGLNLGGMTATALTLEGATQAMVTAGINASVAHTTTRLATSIATHGNLGEAISDLKRAEFLRTLGVHTVAAAATAGITNKLRIENVGFIGRLKHNLVHSTVATGAQSMIGGQDFSESLKHNLLTGGIDALSGYGAERVGASYGAESLNWVSHKVLHGLLGAFQGGVVGAVEGEDFVNAAASGAAGGMIAEMIAETYRETFLDGDGIPLSDVDQHKEYASTLAQAASVMVTHLAGGDITAAQAAAKNAAENNAWHKVLDAAILIYDLSELGYGYVRGDEAAVKEALANVGVSLVSMLNPTGNLVGYGRVLAKGTKLAKKATKLAKGDVLEKSSKAIKAAKGAKPSAPVQLPKKPRSQPLDPPKNNNQAPTLTKKQQKERQDKHQKEQKIHVTYKKVHPESGQVYTGRTSGTGDIKSEKDTLSVIRKRDRNHHKNKEGFGEAELDRVSKNPDAIRGQEQKQIEKMGGSQKSGGSSGNTINSISAKNKKRDQYFEAAKKEFKD